MITPHHELIDRIIEIGVNKTSAPTWRIALLAICAGTFVALGGMLSVAVGFGMPEIAANNPGFQKLLSGLLFPVGLFLVVLFGAELFTGNNALLMPGASSGRLSVASVVWNWIIVWVFNFVGALLFILLFVQYSGLLNAEPYHSAIIGIATAKASLPFGIALVKGIAANWCVCLAVWLGLMVKTLPAKALACWIPVAAFVILGYEHSIANMFFIPAGMMQGADISIANLFANLGAVTLGNIIGGSLLVGLLYHSLHYTKK